MIYSQLRENERTARLEVRLTPGNRCKPSIADSESKSKTKKVGAQTWTLAEREESTWVDLESELHRLESRAPVDFGLQRSSAATDSAAGELLDRLAELENGLYSGNALEDYLGYLSLLNIFEYFRLVTQLATSTKEAEHASQVGIVGEEYFNCRHLALELDLAELTEWLIAHGVGLPDLSLFLPAYKTEEKAAPKGRKKKGAEEQEEAPIIPDALHHIVELIRLQQAEPAKLMIFVDHVMQRAGLETPREAIAKIRDEAAPWIDVDHFEVLYENMKREQELETRRQQMILERQRQNFEQRARRGQNDRGRGGRPGDRHGRSFEEASSAMRPRRNGDVLTLDGGATAGNEEGTSGEQALAEGVTPTAAPQVSFDEVDDFADYPERLETGDKSFDVGESTAYEGPEGGRVGRPVDDLDFNRGRRKRRRGKGFEKPIPRSEASSAMRGEPMARGHQPAHRQPPNAPHRPQRGGPGRRGVDFDEVQPVSNYSPGLPQPGVPGARPGVPPKKGKWRKR